jgi:uncharacterized linocin/CFP29 family protein
MTTAYEMAAKYIDAKMVEPLRKMRIGRKLYASVQPVPKGTFNVDYQSISEMSDAIVAYDLPDEAMLRDMIGVSLTTLKIPIIHKGFKIPRAMFEAFASKGMALDLAGALSAAEQVAEAEDTMLIQGWAPDGTNYVVNGFYQGYANTTAGSSFGTFGGALTSVADALALIRADGVKGTNFNLVLHPTQHAELEKSVSTGVVELSEVKKLINPVTGAGPGDVYWTTDLTDGTGLVVAVDTEGMYFDIVVAQEAFTEVNPDSKLGSLSPLFGHVAEVLVPRIKHGEAICRLTTI